MPVEFVARTVNEYVVLALSPVMVQVRVAVVQFSPVFAVTV